jgi:hypothetical protein
MKRNFQHFVQETRSQMRARMILIFLNANDVWKSWNLSISHDITHEGCGKKLSSAHFVMHDA